MPRSPDAKSCSSQHGANPSGAPVPRAAQRLSRRSARMKAQVGHDFMNTLSAARRHKHVNKQMRLVKELKAELLEMKTLLEALRGPPRSNGGPRKKR